MLRQFFALLRPCLVARPPPPITPHPPIPFKRQHCILLGQQPLIPSTQPLTPQLQRLAFASVPAISRHRSHSRPPLPPAQHAARPAFALWHTLLTEHARLVQARPGQEAPGPPALAQFLVGRAQPVAVVTQRHKSAGNACTRASRGSLPPLPEPPLFL